jgi:AraC-like DNA-binding protein
MKAPYKIFRFDWLVGNGHPSAILLPEDGDVDCLPYPFPAEIGEGFFQKVELALNMTVFRGVHRFTPEAVGHLIQLAEIEVNFPEPTFMVQVLRGGRILHREKRPVTEVIYSPGLDLFRLTDQLNLTPILDGSQSSEMTCLTVGRNTLINLIGSDVAEQLMQSLTLTSYPKVVVRPMPLHVSTHLHGAIGTSQNGAARKLSCQARILDYLGALIDHTQCIDPVNSIEATAKARTHALHEMLLANDGKPPSLDDLARQFSCSARRLNQEFLNEYGQSIYAFITENRLKQAHAAIKNTDTPLKRLAEHLGYSHVNHFNAAFKKCFGYPPGSLRRK